MLELVCAGPGDVAMAVNPKAFRVQVPSDADPQDLPMLFGDVSTELLRAAHGGDGLLVGRLGLTDGKGEPRAARVRPPRHRVERVLTIGDGRRRGLGCPATA
ncbi:DUF5990 family protein [Phytohabitans flavus]|uniref:DUF5990 family protein n=1 Tax=Phytohabitans flavus TaxID=1076124 RepID=UPI00156512BE|nr:DUF5990 family protein [Phytohabitans flavus]